MSTTEQIESSPTLMDLVVYALEDGPPSHEQAIFLAGPTPRGEGFSWRPAFIDTLRALGYSGVIYVPESRDGVFHGDYMAQVRWEEQMLARADVIVFWVPRDMATMPALTTNVEWGVWCDSGKAVLGCPPEGVRNGYLRHYASQLETPHSDTMAGTAVAALTLLGAGALRTNAERDVPLMVWRTAPFATWYASQVAAGNALVGARVLWTFRVGPTRATVFSWVLHVEVYITAENRIKSNEFILARPDISCVLLYRPAPALDETEVVLVREYRAPVVNDAGFVYELPGGSAPDPALDASEIAAHEVEEETGLALDSRRMRRGQVRQLAATLSIHRAHLFSAELTADEIDALRADADQAHGVVADTERAYVVVSTVGQIRREGLVDWSTLGMILGELAEPTL